MPYEDYVINKSKIIKDAQKFVAKAQWDKAITEYEKILAESPADANTHNTVGDLYLKKNDSEKAIISYKKAADIFNRSGFTLKAIALYKKVLNIKPDDIDIMLLMGKLNAERGMLGNANESYLAAAAYFTKQGQKLRAIEVYKTLCDLNPENSSLAQKLAELYLSEGYDSDGIIKHIELAEKKIVQGDLAGAGELLQAVAPKGSKQPSFVRVSAYLDLKSNRLPEAIDKLEGIIKDEPDDVRVISLLAEAYSRSSLYDKAAGLYGSLLEKEPGNMTFRRQLFDAYLLSGDSDSAWKESKTLVEAHIARSEFTEAERLLEDFLVHNPKSIDARVQLADTYHKTGREEDTARLHMEMADLYFESAEMEKAANIYRDLLEKNPDDEAIKAKLSMVIGQAEVPIPEAVEEEPFVGQAEEMLEASAARFTKPDEDATTPPWLEESPVSSVETAAGAETAEEVSAAGRVFELPDEPAGLPPDLSEGYEEEAHRSDTGQQAVEMPDIDLDELMDLDIFKTDEEEEPVLEEAEAVHVFELPEVFEEPGDMPAVDKSPAHVTEEASIGSKDEELAESISEIDVYIRSGLIDKAMTALSELEEQNPASPELKERRLEVCKSLGDIDGFMDASVELARIYEGMGRGEESERVVKKALDIDPGDERLTALLREFSPTELPGEALVEPPEEALSERKDELAELLKEAPVEIPTEATAELPEETQAELPGEAPAGLPEDTLAVIPEEALAEPPEDALAELRDELAELLEEAPVEISTETQAELPEEAQAEIPTESLAELSEGPLAGLSEESRADLPDKGPAEIPAEASAELPEAPIELSEQLPAELPEGNDLGGPAVDDFVQAGPPEDLAPGSSRYIEEMSEAEFYTHQGLTEEAALIYRRLLEVNPDDPTLLSRYEALTTPSEEPSGINPEQAPASELSGQETEAAPAAPETPLPDFPAVDEFEDKLLDSQLDAAFGEIGTPEEPAAEPDSEFFDLAAILKDELDESGPQSPRSTETFADKHLEEVFLQFKKGVEEQLGKEDYETHYNLGIAYKEMGMLDEAIGEFDLAARDSARALECASMRGLCFIEKGDYEEAIRQFQAGLDIKGREKGEYLGLKYDLGAAYELKGDLTSAQRVVNELFREDEGFRDVSVRLQRLNKTLLKAGIQPEEGTKPEEDVQPGPDKPTTPPKKSKVSYL